MQTWLSNIRKYYEATALLMAAVFATLHVFYGSWRAGIVVASLVIALSLSSGCEKLPGVFMAQSKF